MRCPKCKLENPDGADYCDCGFGFGGRPPEASSQALREIADSAQTIKVILIVMLVAVLVQSFFAVFPHDPAERIMNPRSGEPKR